MQLRTIKIDNIRSLGTVEWETPGGTGGWHVIIGDNGAGKSTFLRAIALALVGRENALALRQDWDQWLPPPADFGSVLISLSSDYEDEWAGRGRVLENYYPQVGINFKKAEGRVHLVTPNFNYDPERHAWSDKRGWFSASFGPFRRFQGGDKDEEKLFYSHPKLARHLSVFGENVALSECLKWLFHLYVRQKEGKRDGALLDQVKRFINQPGFLPHGVGFEAVDSDDFYFHDGNGTRVSVTALSDGFRSVLSFTFEVIRQMAQCFGIDGLFAEAQGLLFVNRSGVVLVDEIDAHLHPTWQRSIGFWLTKHFPKVQFIVSTHSPLICHAAEGGSIFRLPTPGSEELPRMASGIERDRLIFGSVLDAYGTEFFGRDVSRSESAQKMQHRLAELNQKALVGDGLTTPEDRERKRLQALFPAPIELGN